MNSFIEESSKKPQMNGAHANTDNFHHPEKSTDCFEAPPPKKIILLCSNFGAEVEGR